MSRRSQFSLRTFLVAALVVARTFADTGFAAGDETASIIKKLGDAKWAGSYRPTAATCKYVSGLYRSLFAAAGPNGLSRLQSLPDDSIAIQAAWESVALTVPLEMTNEPVRLDADRLNWFVGFFEGRARVSLPKGWRELMLDARTNQRDNIFPGEPKSNPYHDAVAGRVKCPTDASVNTSSDAVVFRIAADRIMIPEKIMRRAEDGGVYFNVSGCFTPERCFLAVHNDFGAPHDVACIDRSSGKLLWKSTACGSCWHPVWGSGKCWVWVVFTDDDRVFVFGAESCGFYVHAFNADDGKSLLHFSSRY